MAARLHTGIDVLDRKLAGGLPPGSLVAYTADPASQSELLLYELTAARETLYLTTERSERAVRDALESSRSTVGNPTIRRVDSNDPIEQAEKALRAVPEGGTLIVDTANVLEWSPRKTYLDFLNRLKERMVETDGLAILHCLTGEAVSTNRTRTEHAADAVFDLRTRSSGGALETTLSIPKFRGGGQPTETIKLELTEAVAIDTSRDIA